MKLDMYKRMRFGIFYKGLGLVDLDGSLEIIFLWLSKSQIQLLESLLETLKKD